VHATGEWGVVGQFLDAEPAGQKLFGRTGKREPADQRHDGDEGTDAEGDRSQVENDIESERGDIRKGRDGIAGEHREPEEKNVENQRGKREREGDRPGAALQAPALEGGGNGHGSLQQCGKRR
jgi:hypothetical protein